MNERPVKILVADDDSAMRRILQGALTKCGYVVREARTGEEALQKLGQQPADVVVLDIEMPGIGGMEACRQVHSLTPGAGIMMVTVRDSEEDKIRALEAGADDYVTKPFSLRELIARLQAITRRLTSCGSPVSVLRVGGLELNLDHRSLRRAGAEVHLSPTEFSLLAYLMQHADVPIEHGRLLRVIWGPEYGCELEYLRTYIKRLRQKIETDATQPEYLLTVPWLGYRFHDPSKVARPLITAGAGGAVGGN